MEITKNTEVKFYTKTVTPDFARTLLQQNEVNRKLSETHVQFLAKQMTDGKFIQNGDVIKFSKTGRLMDGQHRLSAVVASNETIDMNFCEGLNESAFDVLDTGRPRGASDVLSIHGIKNPFEQASAARYLMLLKNEDKTWKFTKKSNKDILDVVVANPDISEGVELFKNSLHKKFPMLPVSVMASLYVIFKAINFDGCNDFFNKFYTGLDLKGDNPIYILRNILINNSVATKKYTIYQKMEFVVLAWNLYRSNKAAKFIKLGTDGFPKAI